MGVFHYLNVLQGDCSIIQHPSGHVSVIDIFNAQKDKEEATLFEKMAVDSQAVPGNFGQKKLPANPIKYLQRFSITSVFRFILTHPDMDHMGGIKDFFDEFQPANFWDTQNIAEKTGDWGGGYNEDDWEFYVSMRDESPQTSPKRLTLYAGALGKYFNQDENGTGGGDGLHVLAPTKELMTQAREADDYNDTSYVILYRSNGGRILLAGDSHDATWEHILENHEGAVEDVDLLIAPHHGRKSDRSYDFLDVVNPALTFFGNANSEHLAYGAWNYKKLPFITNNQANCMVVDTNSKPMRLFVTNKKFAQAKNSKTYYSNEFQAYYVDDFGY